jgi:hypothetical protein
MKGEVFEKFNTYKALVENQISMKFKTLQSDNRGKFVSKRFNEFCVNVEFNDKKMHHRTHHNKVELQNEPIRPSWNTLEA